MELVPVKYNPRPYTRQILSFGGLNLSDNFRDGQLADCTNLSTLRYPYITQRGARTESSLTFSSPTNVFSWDGKLLVVDNGKLMWNGTEIGTLSSGDKRFAVVNTKLCIFPDKKYIDLTDNHCKMLESQCTISNATITANSITGSPQGITSIQQNDTAGWTWEQSTTGWRAAGTSVSFLIYNTMTIVDDTPVFSGPVWVQPKHSGHSGLSSYVGKYIVPIGTANTSYGFYNKKWYGPEANPFQTPIYSGTPNTDGVYGVISSVYEKNYEEESSSFGEVEYTDYSIKANLYKHVTYSISDNFNTGDVVEVTNGTEVKIGKIQSITATNITFTSNILTAGSAQNVSVKRNVPDLDYICQSGNRLWGVSNATTNTMYDDDGNKTTYQGRCIYASALGDPTNFFDYSGVSTDSYAVGVASEGDFTAICSYSSGVLCWKENELIKILGSYPAEYNMYTHHIAGVQNGSHKSLVNINETLYYDGIAGTYAYNGGTPTIISHEFGFHRFTDVTAGTDGIRYYVCMKEGDTYHLLTYDPMYDMWYSHDQIEVKDFCFHDGTLRLLTGGKLYSVNTSEPASCEWMAQFCPFYENITSTSSQKTMSRKIESRILIRADLDGTLKVEVRRDDGDWEQVAFVEHGPTAYIPLQPKRCDKFEIRLSGNGICTIKNMIREFKYGSDLR